MLFTKHSSHRTPLPTMISPQYEHVGRRYTIMKRAGFSSIDFAYLRRNSDGSCWMLSWRIRSRSSALFFVEEDTDDT